MKSIASSTLSSNALTTLQVARRIGVSVGTVQHWVERGLLNAWKTPGGHRRIDPQSVSRMEAEQKSAAQPGAKVLLLSRDEQLTALCKQACDQGRWTADVSSENDPMRALIAAGHLEPNLVVIDADDFGSLLDATVAALMSQPFCSPPDFCITFSGDADRYRKALPKHAMHIPILTKPIDLNFLGSIADRSVTNPFSKRLS
jgi:excisionase family DNA binding protein